MDHSPMPQPPLFLDDSKDERSPNPPPTMIVNLSDCVVVLHVIPGSQNIWQAYFEELEMRMSRLPQLVEDYSKEDLLRVQAETDEVIAERFSHLKSVVLRLEPQEGALMHGNLLHAGAGATPEAEQNHAVRLYIAFQHENGPKHVTDPSATYTAKYALRGYITDKIAAGLPAPDNVWTVPTAPTAPTASTPSTPSTESATPDNKDDLPSQSERSKFVQEDLASPQSLKSMVDKLNPKQMCSDKLMDVAIEVSRVCLCSCGMSCSLHSWLGGLVGGLV
jgi:hypothetical protein